MIKTIKTFNIKQANTLMQYGAHVLKIGIDNGKVYIIFEVNHYFKELMRKWKKRQL